MRDKKKLGILGILVLVISLLFLFQGLNANNFDYNISKRIPKLLAMIITGGAIAFSSLIFQTLTNNRILTPSILGLDSLYGLSQTFVVFIFGAGSIFMINAKLNFIVSVSLMILNSLLLYKFVFKKNNNIFFLLLVGTVLGILFKSLSTFMQVLIDPNEYQALQGKLFANFNNVNVDILIIAIIIILIVFAFVYDDIKKLDALLLGREQAINLGIDYDKFSKKILLIVAVLVSVSTALVGPVTFLGLLVANLSYQFMNSYKHKYLIIASIFISILALVGRQYFVVRVYNYSCTVSIIMNFIVGFFYIYLLLR